LEHLKNVLKKLPPRSFPLLSFAAGFLLFSFLSLLPQPQSAAVSAQAEGSLSGLHFLIDPGHGGFDAGASGTVTGVPEAPLNLAVAEYVQQELLSRGARVTMTRTDEEALASTKREDMALRQQALGRSDITAAISIHMNKHTTPDAYGPMVFYYYQCENTPSVQLAQLVQKKLNDAVSLDRERAAYAGDYLVLRSGSAPCILVECGFLSHPREELLLQQPDYQQLLAGAIVDGIEEYFASAHSLPTGGLL
jgi:N-acetylmuramoyl-L-alanine amidase